jgi:uncharacterized membrane protein
MYVKSRRGNMTVLAAAFLTAAFAASAVTVDSTRLSSMKHELQFSADAGAHAGVIQLMAPNDARFTLDTARAFAIRYQAMEATIDVDSVEMGAWDQRDQAFRPGLKPFNAVRIVVSRQPSGLLASLGVSPPRIRARAVGWVQHDSVASMNRIVLTQ